MGPSSGLCIQSFTCVAPLSQGSSFLGANFVPYRQGNDSPMCKFVWSVSEASASAGRVVRFALVCRLGTFFFPPRRTHVRVDHMRRRDRGVAPAPESLLSRGIAKLPLPRRRAAYRRRFCGALSRLSTLPFDFCRGYLSSFFLFRRAWPCSCAFALCRLMVLTVGAARCSA